MLKISLLLLFCLLPVSNELPVKNKNATKSYIMTLLGPNVKETLFFAHKDSKISFWLSTELPVENKSGLFQAYLRWLLKPFTNETLFFARNVSDPVWLNLVIRQSPFSIEERILPFYDKRQVMVKFQTQDEIWLTLCQRRGTEGLRMDRFQAGNHTIHPDIYCHPEITPFVTTEPADYSWIWDYLTYLVLISILVFLVSSIYRRTFCNSKKMPEDTPMTTSP